MNIQNITGPSYNYAKNIKPPSQLQMGPSPGQLANNVAGIMDYIAVLVEGGGPASKRYGQPLGNRYFVETNGKCKLKNGKSVPRSLYINNVPDGTIPFLSELNIKIDSFKGLVPGIMENIDELNPLHLFSAFTESTTPPCRNIHMNVINDDNIENTESGFVVDSEIKNITPCAFANNKNPITNETCKETFIQANEKLRQHKPLYTNKKYYTLKNKPLANVYTALIGGLMVYIIYKLVLKKDTL